MVFQPNFYLLCVICLQRLHEGEVAVYECYAGEGKRMCSLFQSTVSLLDIPRMRIVTIHGQDIGINFRWLHKKGEMLEPFVKLSSWIYRAAVEPSGGLTRSSAFMLLLGNTSRGRTHQTVTLMQVTIVTSEPSLLKTERSFS